MKISLALHILGIIMFVGSQLILTRYLSLAMKFSDSSELSRTFAKKVGFGWLLPGFILTLLTGLYQFFYRGVTFYLKQGWFHGKLTILLVLLVVAIMVLIDLNKYLKNMQPSSNRFMIYHKITGASLLIILFLTIMGR